MRIARSHAAKAYTFILTFTSLTLSSLALPLRAAAQITKPWTGVCVREYTDRAGQTYQVATIQGLQCLIGNLLMIAVAGIGLAGFVMMLVGAFTYLRSGGNSKGIEESKSTITYAIIGLVVSLSAYFVLNIISQFTGIKSILNFSFPVF